MSIINKNQLMPIIMCPCYCRAASGPHSHTLQSEIDLHFVCTKNVNCEVLVTTNLQCVVNFNVLLTCMLSFASGSANYITSVWHESLWRTFSLTTAISNSMLYTVRKQTAPLYFCNIFVNLCFTVKMLKTFGRQISKINITNSNRFASLSILHCLVKYNLCSNQSNVCWKITGS